MPIPDYQTAMRPVLQAFADGAKSVPDTLPFLIQVFNISEEEQAELVPTGTKTILSSRAHWARTYMSKAGLLTSPKRGIHEITQLGRQALRDFPERIDNKILENFGEFAAWRLASASTSGARDTQATGSELEVQTPEDRLEVAYLDIETALISDVLDAVLSMSPGHFEKLVVDLLLAMGYGGGELARGRQTSLSQDGGIDGVVNEDELGLDAVYIQAKRYAPENKVGRPALNAFVGSLTGEGANKGVFVTTSDFSVEATRYVEKVQHRIVLINGERLARLMIKHEVGVRARRNYVLRSVDEDYFSDI